MDTKDIKDDVIPSTQQQPPRTKRKRWGERPATGSLQPPVSAQPGTATTVSMTLQPQSPQGQQKISELSTTTNSLDPKAKVLAMQESIRARLAAAKAAQQQQHQVVAGNMTMTTAAASGLLKRPLSGMMMDGGTTQPVIKKAKVYEVDLTVTAPTYNDGSINNNESRDTTIKSVVTTKGAAAKVATQVKPSNPYLSHQTTDPSNTNDDELFDDTVIDPRLIRTSKVRKRHKEFHFIEPGKYLEIAVTKREKEVKAIASGYLSGRKIGHTIIAPTVASVVDDSSAGGTTLIQSDAFVSITSPEDDNTVAALVPRPEYDDNVTIMPIAMEWWDIELLPSKLKKEVGTAESKLLLEQTTKKTKLIKSSSETANTSSMDIVDDELLNLRQRCYEQASYSCSKTTALVQHIVPIQPTNLVQAEQNQKQIVLHLTKKELKRQRKLRRQEQQREQQDLQAAGLLPAPEPRLTLRNFIQVLGDQAYLDPSQIEQKVQEQMLARQRTHNERNEAAKLTKEQRAAKLARKYEEDTTTSVTTAIFYVKDMSHPYHRTKVDLNAQQLNLSGCVVECNQDPSFACVIVEGGPKAIKRYSRLMLVRMKWTGTDNAIEGDDDDEEMDADDDIDHITHKFNPNNMCQVVWQGLSIKRLFHGFIFQACTTQEQGRKIFKTKGVTHYWDQVLQRATSLENPTSSIVKLKLYHDEDDDEGHNLMTGMN